jgi:hypothetical protein
MRRKYLLFGAALAVAGLYAVQNLVWIHPFPPHPLLAAVVCVCCVAAILSAPTRGLRALAILTTISCTLVTAYCLHSYRDFRKDLHGYASFAASLLGLQAKIESYLESHPGVLLTSLSDYVQAGAMTSADTNFLKGASVRMFGAGFDSNTFMEVRLSPHRFIVMRDGTLYQAEDRE